MNTNAKASEQIRPRPGRKVIHETALVLWISSKFKQFQDDPNAIPWIGVRSLTPEKLGAALDMLRVGSYILPKLFKASGKHGPSYKVLRKWRTEKAFKTLMDRLAEEYLEGFFNEFLADARILYESFNRDTKDSLSRKHEALSVRWLAKMLVESNDEWGKILYQKAFQRLPALIRKEKNPGVIGQLYMLLLVCHCRWPQKLEIDPKEGREYQKVFQDFMMRLGQDWSNTLNVYSPDVAKIYAEALLTYTILIHGKLTAPIFKHDAPVGSFSLMNAAEQFYFMKGFS